VKLGHVADAHLGHRQYGLKQREEDVYLSLESVLNGLEKEGVDVILLPGDLFDTRDLSPSVLRRTEEILADTEVPVLVSPGNHDQNIYPRDVTWLRYLHEKGHILLLEADLSGDIAEFERTSLEEPSEESGGYVDLETSNGGVRVFGMQWRGAYTDTALRQVAEGIQEVNEKDGDPLHTVLMGHFGVEEIVPDLGPNVSFPDLKPIEDLVDYLALGHIHKQYEAEDWVYNPGSPEALDVQEGRWKDEHGYYVIDVDEDGLSAKHHLSKRRPYGTVEFSVTGHPTVEEMKGALREHLEENRQEIKKTQNRDIHTSGGEPRGVMLNLRLTGTLLVDRSTFDVDELKSVVKDELDALHVQVTDTTETKEIQDLLEDTDEEVMKDGEINYDALERSVFERIAEESQYSADAEGAAETVGQVETLVNREGEPVETIAEYVQEQRRSLFPDGAETEIDRDTEEAQKESETEEPQEAETDGGDTE
jgi:exonuclease SbcD